MPSVWDMMDRLNIPDCKVTAFPRNCANIFDKSYQQPFERNPPKHFFVPILPFWAPIMYNRNTIENFVLNLDDYANYANNYE